MHRADPQVLYGVPKVHPGWELSDENMPESVAHRHAVDLLYALLTWWARGQDIRVAANLAIRWDESQPKIGVDPDVCVLSPSPPMEGRDLRSVRTWKAGHFAPRLAVEIVSSTNALKDYSIAPDKYAASGTGELWIFDPLLVGPTSQGGPFRLQVWQRDEEGRLARRYAGEGPATSRYLAAHLVVLGDGLELRVAANADTTMLWLTEAEAAHAAEAVERAARESERAAKESERAAKESERAAKEQALLRIAALEEAARKR